MTWVERLYGVGYTSCGDDAIDIDFTITRRCWHVDDDTSQCQKLLCIIVVCFCHITHYCH